MYVEARFGWPQTVTCTESMKLVQYSTRDKRRINSDKTASEISISLGNKWCNGGLKGPIKKTFSNGNLYFSAVGPKQRDSVETKKKSV